jgi:hypothetical protein
MFTHMFGGGRLMIISPLDLIVQKTSSKTWMQIEVHNKKWHLWEDQNMETCNQEITWLSFHQLSICYMELNEPTLSSGPPPPRWNQMNWKVVNMWWSPWRLRTMVQKEWAMVEGGDDEDFLLKCKHHKI